MSDFQCTKTFLISSMRLKDRRTRTEPLPQRVPLPAALSRRPIGDAAMVSAIRQAGDGIAAAEDEVAATGIADWPVAVLLGQLQ